VRPPEGLEHENGLGGLAPEPEFVAADPIQDPFVEIGKSQKTLSKISRWDCCAAVRPIQAVAYAGVVRTVQTLVHAGLYVPVARVVKSSVEKVVNDQTLPFTSLHFERAGLAVLTLNFGLDCEKAGLYCGGTAQAPQKRGQPKDKLARDDRSWIVFCDNSGFKCGVLVGIFQIMDHGFGSQAVPDRIFA